MSEGHVVCMCGRYGDQVYPGARCVCGRIVLSAEDQEREWTRPDDDELIRRARDYFTDNLIEPEDRLFVRDLADALVEAKRLNEALRGSSE